MTYFGSTALVEEAPRVAYSEVSSQSAAPCLSTAELAECTCPDFCERDHDTD
jgi:hypothetical protein